MKINDKSGSPAAHYSPSTVDGEPKLHIDRKFQGKESILSSQISLFVEETKPNIPDGGWGWFVVFAGFTLNVISEGVTLSFGLLYVKFLDEFKASKSATSWIGSLFMAVPLLVGPVASALVDKYGCRYMSIAGGLITALAFIFSAFANSLGIMYVTFGILGGVGRGLTYVTCVVPMAFWFEKKRSVALGIAASGAGLGTIIFAPLTTLLIGEYGWRGTLLILAGCFLNMCVCGMLMRDPEWMIEEERRQRKLQKLGKNGANAISKKDATALAKSLNDGEESQALLKNENSLENSGKSKFRSVVNLPTYIKHDEKIPPEVLKQLSANKHLYTLIMTNYPKLLENTTPAKDVPLTSDISVTNSASQLSHPGSPVLSRINEDEELKKNEDTPGNAAPQINSGEKNKSKSHGHSYLRSLQYRKNSLGIMGALSDINKHSLKATSCPAIYRNSLLSLAEENEEKWYDQILNMFKFLSQFSLYLELHFLLLTLATINLFIWFIVPYVFLAEHMRKIGFSEAQSSFVLSVIGFTNTVGMVVLGWIGDRLSVAKTYAICLILCGMSILSMMYFTENYTLLVINCGLFGLFFASCFSLSPSLLSQLVPLDEFTLAYGLGLLNEGIGNLIGPPLAGLLYDITQSWKQSFYQAGCWIIISGVLVGCIPFTKNRRLFGSKPLRNDRQTGKDSTPPA